jgi:alpha-amylase/alpha-mannosidase (GH57 family)
MCNKVQRERGSYIGQAIGSWVAQYTGRPMSYICIHSHFYQPPRENPWLEAVEEQDSAYPYHDWNERVTAECYAPNSASRILDNERRIVDIVNNYSRISFDFGPTLLSWLETFAPRVYQAILSADRESRERFSGHGSALGQAYNHMIMPLANSRDKLTQVAWGIADFEHRFGRRPEGMWLPETAVDLETLEILAQHGIAFTILAPRQAKRVRKIGGRNWRDVAGEQIDPTMVYRLRLPSRRSINLFFYDSPISRGVAFERLLDNGERFAERLVGAFIEDRNWPELVHIATDGETYGHHHRHGEMALTYALEHIRNNQLADLTNYGEYLERHPPTHEVEIFENSSWSCIHGIERWRAACGCNAGHPGWNQAWRGPLRNALDWLRDTLAPRFEAKAREYLKDPWAARQDYIKVVLDRRAENRGEFIARNATHPLSDSQWVTVFKLMEIQRHLMLMYTSCGWFFDELSGLETVQVIQYACRAVQLSQEVLGDQVEDGFLQALAQAKSNIPEHQDGACIYRKFARAAGVDLEKLAAHYAITSLFKSYMEPARIYCYSVDQIDHQTLEAGRMKLGLGRARFTSEVTCQSEQIVFAALHFGDHNLHCGTQVFGDEESYHKLVQEMTSAFSAAQIPEVLRVMDNELASTYSVKSMFRDDQRAILKQILNAPLEEAERAYGQIYENHVPLANFLRDLGVPLPKAIAAAAEVALNSNLRREFASEEMDLEHVRKLLKESHSGGITLDFTTLEYTLRQTLERLSEKFAVEPGDSACLKRLEGIIEMARSLPVETVLWTPQNVWAEVRRNALEEQLQREREGDEEARSWVQHFLSLGDKLKVHVPEDATLLAQTG